MKVKVTAGVVAALVAVLALVFIDSYIPIVLLAGVSGTGAYELLKSLSVRNKWLISLTVSAAAAMPFITSTFKYDELSPYMIRILPLAIILFILSFFFIMLSNFKDVTWTHVFVALAGAILIPLGISAFVFIRDFRPLVNGEMKEMTATWARFWVLYGLFCCLLTDAYAYFIGVATKGKHKMAPLISPNKSWEGAISGVVLNTLSCLIMWYVFKKYGFFGEVVPPWWLILSTAPLLSVLGVLGDLTFSAVKRQTGIKDFGNLIPGHGGALDRFDSYIFVMPSLWGMLWMAYH